MSPAIVKEDCRALQDPGIFTAAYTWTHFFFLFGYYSGYSLRPFLGKDIVFGQFKLLSVF